MIRDKKEMLNFEEVDKIETFFGLNKGMILGRGINRIIMEFKWYFHGLAICDCHFLELIES